MINQFNSQLVNIDTFFFFFALLLLQYSTQGKGHVLQWFSPRLRGFTSYPKTPRGKITVTHGLLWLIVFNRHLLWSFLALQIHFSWVIQNPSIHQYSSLPLGPSLTLPFSSSRRNSRLFHITSLYFLCTTPFLVWNDMEHKECLHVV